MKYEDLEPGKVYERCYFKYRKLENGVLQYLDDIDNKWENSSLSFTGLLTCTFTELPPVKKKVSKTYWQPYYVNCQGHFRWDAPGFSDKDEAIEWLGIGAKITKWNKRTETWED